MPRAPSGWPRPCRRRGVAAAASAAGAAAGAAVALRWSALVTHSFVPAPPAGAAAAVSAAAATTAGAAGLGTWLETSLGDSQLLLAREKLITGKPSFLVTEEGSDNFYIFFGIAFAAFCGIILFTTTKPFWEKRWLQERVNTAKLKFISQESECTPEDQYELGRLYISLPDPSSALAEFEEVEEEFDDMRRVLDPEDAMGALAARAMLHNSKGFALTNLEPPRTAQARREFVRAVTYWPEYPEGLLNIGRELIKRKRYDVALRTLNTALKWQPGSEYIQKTVKQAESAVEEAEYQAAKA